MTAYIDGTTGETYYAKPLPLSSSPSWGDDVVSASENGSTGQFAFANDATKVYWVFLQAGGSPASSDVATHVVDVEAPTASANATAVRTELATELGRIDAAVSTRSTLTAQQVWEYSTRSLSTFGSLASDIATAVWSAGTRTLTAISDSSGVTTLLSRIVGTLASGTHQPQTGDSFARLGTPAGASIAADIAAIEGGGGSGTGARTVTITVNDGSTALQNATVRLTEGANTFTATTNVSGVATFNLDDATYTVAISKSGYSYSGTTLVVNGDETATYSMTLISISAPDDPSLCACAIYVKDQKGVAVESATVKTIIQSVDAVFVDETLIINTTGTATTNANGLATINLIQGQTYEITVSVASQEKSSFDYTVPAESTARINVTA